MPLLSILSARATTSDQLDASSPPPAFRLKLPSLDFSNSPAAQVGASYWPGAGASGGAVGGPPSNTLPTPPTTESDAFKPPSHSRESSFAVGNGALHQPGMSSNIEAPAGSGSSLTARRPAANSLPNFELPPPQPLPSRYLPYSTINSQPPPASLNMSNLSNLLTPPSNIPGDNHSPMASGVNGVSPPATNGMPPYTPGSYWPPTGSGITPFSLGTTGTMPQPWAQGAINPLFPHRPMFSPSLNSLVRNSSNSPSASEGLPPPPPFDLNPLPPFTTSMSMSTPANLPTIASQQAAAQAYLNSQTPVSSAATQPSPLNVSESYLQRPPPTPTFYSGSQASTTPQQNHFPPFQTDSPVQQSPMSASTQGSRISPVHAQLPNLQSATLQSSTGYVRPFPSYPLPAMNGANLAGPIMSNVHSPGGQMAIVGGIPHGLPGGVMPGFNSGHSAQIQQMYGGPPPAPHNERPFKCDQCPQSFNRNHDLKRHKRIHLAVKPFPCGYCEKSFSRKDALKVSSLRPCRRGRFD